MNTTRQSPGSSGDSESTLLSYHMPSDTSGVGRELVPARLQVRLLGAVEIILDGRRLRGFNSLRLQRFLALIALRRDPQHRSRLAFELWPDSDERQARTNLRKLLHDFRHSLPNIGEFVEIDNEIVRWIPTGPSEVDVLRFRDTMAAGDLELAARLYSGDLLPACYDDWVLAERAKLRAEAYGALVQLTEEAAKRDDHKATIGYAQRIIDLEPTDETPVRIQMEAHLALGDRAAALRAYHRYAEVLERDLAVAPGKAIGALYQHLRTGALNRDEAQDLPVAESPFVGHEHLALYAQDPKAVCLVRLAWVELWAGDAGRADQTARSALEIAVVNQNIAPANRS